MGVRKRKGKGSKEEVVQSSPVEDDNGKSKKNSKSTAVAKNKKSYKKSGKIVKGKQALLFVFTVIGIAGSILYYFYSMYGPALFLGLGHKDFKIEPYQWRNILDNSDKTILLIGGPHRSGTTITWDAITSHPEVVGFGGTFETGADYSEGILFQDVYPAFGVGMEFSNFGKTVIQKERGDDNVQMATDGGIGQYALLPNTTVHLTKENHKGKLNNSKTLSKLMNRFAPHWDSNAKYDGKDGLRKAKVWVEKSPQNIVLSSFLESVYNMPIAEDGSVEGMYDPKAKSSVTKFIYVTRHPIANILATDFFIQESMGGHRDFEILIRNYIQMHKYANMDSKELSSPFMWVKFEDFAENPSKTLKEIFKFLEVASDDETINSVLHTVGTIKSNTNAKYMKQWCDTKAVMHGHLFDKYKDEFAALNLGYDLTNIC
mmetsp:Transcript_10431/g.13197  ORF Transcript_10431/g.13197 Transcript_10431/m.13197 type:complete len:430 (-) Transcript_10431:182-1471(-)